MKKALLVMLSLCLCCALSVSAVAAPLSLEEDTIIQPRFRNISLANCSAAVIDGYLCMDAELYSYGTMSLSISATVTTSGMTPRTFTVSKIGNYMSFYEEMPAVDGKVYSIAFTYTAGGESHTETILA